MKKLVISTVILSLISFAKAQELQLLGDYLNLPPLISKYSEAEVIFEKDNNMVDDDDLDTFCDYSNKLAIDKTHRSKLRRVHNIKVYFKETDPEWLKSRRLGYCLFHLVNQKAFSRKCFKRNFGDCYQKHYRFSRRNNIIKNVNVERFSKLVLNKKNGLRYDEPILDSKDLEANKWWNVNLIDPEFHSNSLSNDVSLNLKDAVKEQFSILFNESIKFKFVNRNDYFLQSKVNDDGEFVIIVDNRMKYLSLPWGAWKALLGREYQRWQELKKFNKVQLLAHELKMQFNKHYNIQFERKIDIQYLITLRSNLSWFVERWQELRKWQFSSVSLKSLSFFSGKYMSSKEIELLSAVFDKYPELEVGIFDDIPLNEEDIRSLFDK